MAWWHVHLIRGSGAIRYESAVCRRVPPSLRMVVIGVRLSMNNYYFVQKLVKQRQDDLQAEAANWRLANEVPRDRRYSWRQLTERLVALVRN